MSKDRTPQLKSYRSIVPFVLLLAMFTLTGCPPDEIELEKERVVLIFSDVTSSLLPSESGQVGTLTSDVVDSLLPGSRYYVYPVQIEAQKIETMDEGIIVVQDLAMSNAVKKARREKISQEIKKLYELIKSKKRRPDAYGNPDNHTCILYTLEFAQNKFKQFDRNKTEFELIYVSDMIEQCNRTPMGKPISLGQTNISEAVKLAKDADLKLDLSYANVSMIIPATNDTYVTGGRPNLSDLRDFWKGILSHCGFTEELLQKPERFYFSSDLPIRFKSP